MRVVSLLPSATEMLYALGVEPVGVSHECDYPPAAKNLPSVIDTRIDPTTSSIDINEQVTEAVQTGGVYEIDRETLAALDPDIIVSQGVCDVCAVDDAQIRQTVLDLELDAEIVTTDPHNLEDVFEDIERLGNALSREERAASVLEELRRRVEQVERATSNDTADGPRVAVFDWVDPVMVAGHWIPDMVERCGAAYGLADPGERSRPREWREIRTYDPEVVVLAPCGFGLDQTFEDLNAVTQREGWEAIAAVETGQVYVMDGHHYVNRPGPRLVDTLELLAATIFPDTVDAPETPGDAVRSVSTSRQSRVMK